MLSTTFPITHWTFLCLLLSNLYSCLVPVVKFFFVCFFVILLFCYWVCFSVIELLCLYILDHAFLWDIHLQLFLPLCRLPFQILHKFLWCSNIFNLMKYNLSVFFILLLILLVSYLRWIHCQNLRFTTVFSSKNLWFYKYGYWSILS